MNKNKLIYLLLLLPLTFFFWKKPESIIPKATIKYPVPIKKEKSIIKKVEPKVLTRTIIKLTPDFSNKNVFINKFNEDWMELLEENLLKFQEPSTKVKISHQESIIFSQYGKSRLAEKVVVQYLIHNQMVSSFNAYVDSQTGEIIGLPWGRTVSEKKFMPKIKPSGVIKQTKNPPKKDKQEETK